MKRLCIDCKNHKPLDFSECDAEQNKKYYPKKTGIGGFTYKWYTLRHLRMDGFILCRIDKTCGKEGRWFEQKEKEETI